MAMLLNLSALQTLVPVMAPHADGDFTPDSEGLKKHFLAVFARYSQVKAFVVKPRKGHYQLRLDRSGILYSETEAGHTKKIRYDFTGNQVLLNDMPQPPLFLKKFMSRLRDISEEVGANSATIYEEVLR